MPAGNIFVMCKKHEGVMYKVRVGCPRCKQERGLTPYEKGRTPDNLGALKRKCRICGKPCFKKVCYVCRSKKLLVPKDKNAVNPSNDKAVNFFQSLGINVIKEKIDAPEKGEGIIELEGEE